MIKQAETNLRYALIGACFAFLLYANTIPYDYVLDDKGVITQNQFVMQGFAGIKNIFTSDVWHFQNLNLGYYRPLSLVSFAVEQQLFPNNPHVSHFVNVLLYSLTAFLLYFLLLKIFNRKHPLFSLVVTLLFIAHPLHTEVVANIKSRDEILSFLNLIAALFVFFPVLNRTKIEAKDAFRILASCFLFYLALLSKETAIVGILLLPVIIYFRQETPIKRVALLSIPFVVMFLLFQFHKYQVFGSLSSPVLKDLLNYPYTDSDLKLPSMLMIFAWCVKLILVPYPLSYSYAYNQLPAVSWASFNALVGVALLVAVVYFSVNEFRKKSSLGVGGIIFIITLLPLLAFVYLKGGIFAERFLYAPVLGFSVVVTSLLFSFSKISFEKKEENITSLLKQNKFSVPFLLLLVLYSVQTISRNTDWKNDETLFTHDVNVSANSSQTHFHYGAILINKAIAEQNTGLKNAYLNSGLTELYIAVAIHPHYAAAYNELGLAHQRLTQNLDSAIYYYNRAIMDGSNDASCFIGLGEIYEQRGKKEFASYYYNKAVEANPFIQEVTAIRDGYKARTGLDVKEFPKENIVIDDSSAEQHDFNYYNQQGMQYGQQGDYENALRCLNKAADINRSSEEVLINLSVCYGMTKQNDKSIETLQRVLLINPANKTALQNLVVMYDHIGKQDKANDYRRKLKELE